MNIVPGVNQRTFTWQDGERTIRFGRGTAGEAIGVLGGPGYALLTTGRARGAAPAVVEAAETVIDVAPGRVDELAGELLGTIAQDRIVALGGTVTGSRPEADGVHVTWTTTDDTIPATA